MKRLASALAIRLELQSHVLEPDAPVGANLEHIVVSMRDWQIEAEAVPAQRIVVGDNAHNVIGGVLVFAGEVRKVAARTRARSDGGRARSDVLEPLRSLCGG